MQYEGFGRLLTEGIKKLAATRRISLRQTHESLADELWVSTRTIYDWRTGRRLPKPDSVAQLARIFAKTGTTDQLWLIKFLDKGLYQPKQAAESLIDEIFSTSFSKESEAAKSADRPNEGLQPALQSHPRGSSATATIGVKPGSLSGLHREDWSEAPDVSAFRGRQEELNWLTKCLFDAHCRTIGILGLGGIGKTSLAAKLAQQEQDRFDIIAWRSWRNAPPLEDLLDGLLPVLSAQPTVDLSNRIDQKISQFVRYLHKRRCLLVFDNVETILREGEWAGDYLSGYEGYDEFLRIVAESDHQSCVILTGREKPKTFAPLEGEASPVRLLNLSGVETHVGRAILKDKHLFGTDAMWAKLIAHYSGNPLALKLVSEIIREVFDGQIAEFLQQDASIFDDIRHLLDRQFERLSDLEQSILLWLAIEREAVSKEKLLANLVEFVSKQKFIEALRSLRRRSLVEKSSTHFTLQNVVLEYCTARLVDRAYYEIKNRSLSLLHSHALIKAQTQDYLRESQIRLILKPIAARLQATLGQSGVEASLKEILETLRRDQKYQSDYGSGNLLNLLKQWDFEFNKFDFSHLKIRQAHLSEVTLTAVNFAYANMDACVFVETFGRILDLAFSPDGAYLAAGTTKGEVCIWQADSGQPAFAIEAHANWVQSVGFSPDGRLLASGSTDQSIRLWDIKTGLCVGLLAENVHRIRSVTFHPSGDLLASGGADCEIYLWDIKSGRLLKTFSGHTDEVCSVVFSPNGEWLASSGVDCTARLWSVDTAQCTAVFEGHTDSIWSLDFGPKGRLLATGSDDQTVRVWDVETGHCLHIFKGHMDQVKSVAISSDGRFLASGSNDQTIRMWSIHSGQLWQTLWGHLGQVWAVAFSPNSAALATGSYNQTLRLWETSTGRCLKSWRGYTHWIWSVAISSESQLMASGSDDNLVRLWDAENDRCLQTLAGHTKWVTSVAFHPRSRLVASGSADQTIRLWDVETGQQVSLFAGHLNWVWVVAFAPGGYTLASGSEDQTIRLWDVETGHCYRTLTGHTARIRSITFGLGEQMLASGSDDRTVRLWTSATGQMVHCLQGHTDWVMAVAFSPDSRHLASGSADRTVRLWDVETFQPIKTFREHAGRVRSIAFHPNGEFIVSGSEDQSVRVWHIAGGQLQQTLLGHTDVVKSVAFSSDGNLVVSAGDDGTLRLWQWQTGVCVKVLRSDRPYERMNITGVTGLTEAQKTALKALGAIED
ncbi:MAG: hypothetical protein KDJ65_09795 [Anaerolineae bacterium]|nr:hypothetical protein [Anaerolineae bacterium]